MCFQDSPRIIGCYLGCNSKFVAVVTGFQANVCFTDGTTRSPVAGCTDAGFSPRFCPKSRFFDHLGLPRPLR